jgi:dihydrofolate reductase
MRNLILFMHVSLDGFVAGPSGEMNWIHVDEEIFDFGEQFINKAGTALYGRVTYDMMEGYWPTAANQPNASRHDINHSKWYMQVDKIVLSKTLTSDSPKVKVINDKLRAEVMNAKNSKGGDILIFGSPSASHSLMEANLIDEYWLYINPILIGKGIPLFKGINDKKNLKLIQSKVFSSGVIALNYQTIVKN